MPYAIEAAFIVAFLIAGAFSRRIAGGLIRTGSSLLARFMGASLLTIPFIILLDYRGYPGWWGIGLVPLYYAGLCTAGFPKKPGTKDSIMLPTSLRDVIGISALNGIPTVAYTMLGLDLLYYFGPPFAWPGAWLIAAGLLFGPAYRVAMLWTPPIRWLGFLNKDKIIEHPPLAEMYVGAMVGLAVYLSVAAHP